MKDSRIIWIGAVADKEYLDYMTEKGNRQSTAYNVQGKFIKGLRYNGVRVDTLNGHVMPPFPKYKGIKIPARTWSNDESENIDAAFINLPLVNLYAKGRGMIRASKKLDVKREDVLLVYSLHSPFLKTACYLKKKTGCTVIAIIPDLPEYMKIKQSIFRRVLKRIDRISIDKYLQQVDGYVLFAEKMKKQLPEKRHTIRVEGLLEFDEACYCERIDVAENVKKVIMYSGNLDLSEGIKKLVQIFKQVKDSECELWITGTGDGERAIKEWEKEDGRIKYWGYITEYDKLLELQQQAKVLVAMVDARNPKSEVFFPSKIMEYLMTGREVMCYKLGGIPDEYDAYLKYFERDSAEKSAELLTEALNLGQEELRSNGMRRIEFLKQKDILIQAEKLLKFIDEVKADEPI